MWTNWEYPHSLQSGEEDTTYLPFQDEYIFFVMQTIPLGFITIKNIFANAWYSYQQEANRESRNPQIGCPHQLRVKCQQSPSDDRAHSDLHSSRSTLLSATATIMSEPLRKVLLRSIFVQNSQVSLIMVIIKISSSPYSSSCRADVTFMLKLLKIRWIVLED